CFMNSILQCLRHTKPLVDFCLNGKYRNEIQENINCSFVAAYTKLMRVTSGTSPYVSPCEFREHITRLTDRYKDYSQHDAQEFLIFLLEMLHCDLKRLNVSEIGGGGGAVVGIPKSKKESEIWNLFNNKEESEIINIFVGSLVSSLKCSNCKTKSKSSEPFLDLSLPLAENDKSEMTLNDCLAYFTKVEVLNGDNKPLCEHCNSKQTFHKKLRFEKFPQILILHLKRFSIAEKQENLIKFPLKKLNLTKFAASKSCPVLYDLYAVSNHMGSLNKGHYTACAKSDVTSLWNEYNDSRLTRIDESQVVTSNAYILFYERIL
ncbi:hypothetical protein HELRODRAFT_88096, partial [Helobdella robusta]|uniref:ubiquitinyl hydrolase 1 n=1 Tax=Helobdella robusta TaxID=6412 RepID=T1G6Y5_HELRO